MKDENRSKQKSVNELNKLRRRALEFDALEVEYKRALKELQKSHDKLEKKIEEQDKELQGINERLRIIVESAQGMTACSEIDKMGELLLKEFARTMAAEGGSIYRVEDDRLILEHSLDPGHASDIIPLPLKKGTVLEKGLKQKKPILIKDIERDKNALKSGWDGYRDGSLIVFPILDEEGEVTAIIALHNRKYPPFVEQDREIGLMLVSYSCEALRSIKSNQALIESEKLLKNILSASSVGIAYARDRAVVWANEAMEKMFGFEGEKDYLGQTTYQLYASDEEYQRVGEIIYEGIKAGQDLMEIDAQFKRKDGSIFDGHARVSFINPSNPLEGIIVSIIDITERKLSEELLKESEEKYRNLFENSIEAVFTVDLDGNFTSINRAVEIFSGYSRDELMGNNAFDFIKPEFKEEVYKKYNDLFKTGRPIEDLTYVFFTKSGEERVLEGYVNVIRKEDRIVGFQGALRDITERKETEEKLRISEERYRDLVENIGDIVYVLDDKGNPVFFNKAAEKSLGYSRDELYKMNYKEYITPESNGHGTEIFRRRLSGEDVGVVEYQFYNKNGEIITVETHESFVWKDGRVVEVHGIGRDTTERKKVEEKLRESEERYRNLIETSNDGIVVIQDGKIVFISRIFNELSDYSEAEIIGESFDKFIYAEDINNVLESYRRRISGEEFLQTYEFRLVDKNGRLIPVETNSVLINWYGKPATLSILRDITERKQAEEALIASERNYREIFNAANEAIFVHHSKTGAILDVNKSMCNMFGYTYEEVLNLTLEDLSFGESPYTVEYAIEWIKKAKDEGPQLFEWYSKKKSGELFWAEVNLKHSNIGGRDCVLAVVRDITDRKRAEEELRASEEKYRTILENIDDGYFEVDIAGNFVFFNDSMCTILGYSNSEMLGMNNRDYMDKEIAKDVYRVFNEVFNTKKTKRSFDWELIRRDKSRAFVSTSVTPIIDNDENVVGFRGIARDITERKQAEQKIREINERMEATFNALPDIFFEVDSHGRIYDYQSPNPELLYADPEEFLGKNLNEFIPEEQSKIIMDSINEAVETGRHIGAVYSLDTPAGVSFFELSIAAKGDPKTEDLRLICLVRDITKRKRAEEALTESEEKYRTLVENAKEAILVIQDGVIKFLNPKAEEISGFSKEEFLLKPFADRIYPDDLEKVMERHERILNGEDLLEPNIYRVFRKDGSLRWVEGTGVSINWDGRPASLSFFTDITAKKATEEALKESEKRYRELVENIDDIIYVLDDKGKFKFINRTLEKNLGYNMNEILNRNFKDFLTPDSYKYSEELFRRMLEGEDVGAFEIEFYDKDGRIRIIESRMQLVYEEGRAVELTGIARDITDRKKIEEQLIQAQRMEAVGTLAGGMAHNFNNILVGIMGYSELLISKKCEGDPDYKALKTIHEGTTRASLLTRELLNIARGGEHKATNVRLNGLIKRIIPLIAGTFDRSIEIETHLAKDLMTIEGDGSRLEQSILNICINARDAMPRGGSIIIETYNQEIDGDFIRTHMDAREGNYVVLSITDTGIGMSHDVKENIFEPFFTTKEDKGGTGMGLSTVYGIVKSHGGFVTVYSEEGEGSTFRLYFPAIKGEFREMPVVKDDEKFIESATILLVDDEQVVIDMWGDFLLHKGHRILTARDGEEALKVYKENEDEIDMVILDYVMPKMGGKDVLMSLRKIDPDVKVLVSSGYSENGQAGEIIQEGANGFVQKPAQLGELYKKIMEILQYKRKR